LDWLQCLEPDCAQRFADEADVVERVRQRAYARLIVFVANEQRNALLGERGRMDQQKAHEENDRTKHHSTSTQVKYDPLAFAEPNCCLTIALIISCACARRATPGAG